MRAALRVLLIGLTILIVGCATRTAVVEPSASARGKARVAQPRGVPLDRSLEDRILALDPRHITERDVRTTLALGPTPRIILLHGSVYPAHLMMRSFAEFLEGMGYPGSRVRDPVDGAYSQSPYQSSERLAGEIAWYYERDGVRPIMIGHSQGGMQAIKVLYQLAGDFSPSIAVWNATTDRAEGRYTITDPMSGAERSVVGLSVAYAAVVGAGGAAFVLPNQWDMLFRLRTIPNTVDEFTGFSIQGDMVAWTLPGTSAANEYRRGGEAQVRNVVLPITYNHIMVPVTHALATDTATRNWINAYVPRDGAQPDVPDGIIGYNVLWAADVWFSIKKHWCIEAQRLIRARRAAADRGTFDANAVRPL
jgi:hypothetical protein